jgi:hypothetical protein
LPPAVMTIFVCRNKPDRGKCRAARRRTRVWVDSCAPGG